MYLYSLNDEFDDASHQVVKKVLHIKNKQNIQTHVTDCEMN